MSSLLGQAQVIYTHTEVELLNLYFDDANQIPDYAKNAIASATVGNLVVNYPNIRPLSSNYNATPGKVAALIYQGLQKVNAMPLQEIAARFVIPPQFDYAQSFSEGLAWVKMGNQWGAIDRTGKLLIQLQYYEHYPFCEGLALVTIGGKYRFIEQTRKIAIQPIVAETIQFIEGLARVKVGNRYEFIEHKQNFAIQPKFDNAGWFSEGLASAGNGNEYGFIDRARKLAIELQFFDEAISLSEGLVAVKVGNQWSYMSLTFHGILSDYRKKGERAKGKGKTINNISMLYLAQKAPFSPSPVPLNMHTC